MWFDNDLLRIIYLPSVLIPVIFPIFSNDLTVVQVLPWLVGWSFLLIHANLFNDFIDKDRKLPVSGKALASISLIFLTFGLFILADKIVYAGIFVALFFVHNLLTSRHIYSDIPVQVAAITMPYLATASFIDAKLFSFFLALSIIAMFIDRLVDEKMNKAEFRRLRVVTLLSVLTFIGFLLYLLVTDASYRFLSPFMIMLLGILTAVYTGRLSLKLKIVSIYGSNAFLFYLIAILATLGKFV